MLKTAENMLFVQKRGEKQFWSSSKGVDKNGATCNMGFGRVLKSTRRDEAITGVEVVQFAAFLVVGQTWFPRSGCQGASVQSVRRRRGNPLCYATQVPQPLPGQRTLTPRAEGQGSLQEHPSSEVSRVPHKRNVGSRNTGNVA